MIRCPQCEHECVEGTLYCDECGCDLSNVAPAAGTPVAERPTFTTEPPVVEAPVSEPAATPASGAPAVGGRPRLVVVRGMRPNEEFPLWEGDNLIGRMDDKAVDIDLEAQESPERMWASRQHAVVRLNGGACTICDKGSANGTFVNRGSRLQSEQELELRDGDMIQIGTVHLKYCAQ